MSRPRCRPSAGRVCPSRPTLPPRRSSWEQSIRSLLQLTRRRFALLRLRRAHHAGELLHLPIPSRFTAVAAPSHHSYPSTCTGSPVSASLPAPLSNPHRWRLSPPLRSFPLRTRSEGSIVSRRTTSPPVSRSRFRRPSSRELPPSCRCPASARGGARA
jgi:hypothetical protein